MAKKKKPIRHPKKKVSKGLEPKPVPVSAPDDFKFRKAKIKIIGIGDGGSQIVSELSKDLNKADFWAVNTDWRNQKRMPSAVKFLALGEKQTQGAGAGQDADLGRAAALAEKENLAKILKGCDLCFLIACLGGGTGCGVSPVLAGLARKSGIVTCGIFTLPFKFEGEKKVLLAKEALEKMRPNLNATMIFPNEKIFQSLDKNISFNEGFSSINKVLSRGLQGLIEILFQPGLINIDFADLKTILEGRGKAAFLTNIELSRGLKVEEIKKKIFQNLFLSYNFRQARTVLFNIISDSSLALNEVSDISQQIFNAVHPEAKIVFGASFDQKLAGKIRLVLLAVGGREKEPFFERVKEVAKARPKRPRRKRQSGPDKNSRSNIEVKVRRNGLEVKKEVQAQEEILAAQEKAWETPAILRKGLLRA